MKSILTDKSKMDLVKNDYNAICDKYISTYDSIDSVRIYLDKIAIIMNNKILLDVGCGSGKIVHYFALKGVKATGLDFSDNFINSAKQNYPQETFILENICKYKTKQKYDGIFAKDMLFHLPTNILISTLEKFNKLLVNNGKLFILMDISKSIGEKIYIEELDGTQKIYYNYLDVDKIIELVCNAGFKINNKLIEKSNENNSSYAEGLLFIEATKV